MESEGIEKKCKNQSELQFKQTKQAKQAKHNKENTTKHNLHLLILHKNKVIHQVNKMKN